MNRRQLAFAGVALAAAATGAGWSVWRANRAAEPEEALWNLRFDAPSGGDVAMRPLRGKPLVLNFWATWCAPCLKELPLLDSFHRQHAANGIQVIGLAVDEPTAVREFLTRHPVGFPIGLAGFEGAELSRQLGNQSGGLPFSAVFNTSGKLVLRKLGALTSDELSGWAKRIRG